MSLEEWQRISGGRILARHLGYLRFQATGVHCPILLQDEKVDGESEICCANACWLCNRINSNRIKKVFQIYYLRLSLKERVVLLRRTIPK